MPRTKSNAALLACRRELKISEPFEYTMLPAYDKAEDNSYMYMLKTLTDYVAPNSLIDQMNDPRSVTKVFGRLFDRYYPARAWLNAAKDSHEVFILLRDFREMVLSQLLSVHFGFTKKTEKEPTEIMISSTQFYTVTYSVITFLRFYPLNGKVVTYETLPVEFFDRSQVTLEEQNSMDKLHLVKNLDEVERNIDIVMAYFRQEWKDVTGLDIYTHP